jgi:hypothetical protein
MTRARYVPEDLGCEVAAPSGYYQPLEEAFLDRDGKRLLYILGTACIEASCCGIGSWQYLRVEGYVGENDSPKSQGGGEYLEIDTIDIDSEKSAIIKLLLGKHPGARIEFR